MSEIIRRFLFLEYNECESLLIKHGLMSLTWTTQLNPDSNIPIWLTVENISYLSTMSVIIVSIFKKNWAAMSAMTTKFLILKLTLEWILFYK